MAHARHNLSRDVYARGGKLFFKVSLPTSSLPSFFLLSFLSSPPLLLFPNRTDSIPWFVRSKRVRYIVAWVFWELVYSLFFFFYFILSSIAVSSYARGLPRKIEFLQRGGRRREEGFIARTIDRSVIVVDRIFLLNDILIVHVSENEKFRDC